MLLNEMLTHDERLWSIRGVDGSTPCMFWSSLWICHECSLWQKCDFLSFLLKMLLFLN